MRDLGEGQKWIPGFEGRYVADKLGNIWSYCRKQPFILRSKDNGRGYYTVSLSQGKKKYKHLLVHRLILQTFIGPCPEGMECRHLDGTRDNNCLENLEWGTLSQNQIDRHGHGTSNSKISLCQVKLIRFMSACGDSVREIHRSLGVKYHIVDKIVKRKTFGWCH